MKLKDYAFLSGCLFLLIAFFHALRIISGWMVDIHGIPIPYELSWLVVIIAGSLAYFGITLSKK